MALDTFSDLKSSITSWLVGRTDLAPQTEDFIALAEADFNRIFRVREMEDSADLTPDGDGEASLPADYLAYRTVTALTSPRRVLEFYAPSQIEDAYRDRAQGWPNAFTIYGSTMLVLPISAYSVRLDYYAKIPSLSDSVTSNWLLAKYPNVYLFACLKYAAVFIRDDEAAATYGGLFNGLVDAMQRDDQMSRWSRAGARVKGPTP